MITPNMEQLPEWTLELSRQKKALSGGGNEVYSGTDPDNTIFPIGHILTAYSYVSGRSSFNATVTIYLPEPHQECYISDFWSGPKGEALAGRWAFRGRCGVNRNVGVGIFQRIA